MTSIIEGYNYDTRLRLSYGGQVFMSYRQKKEGEIWRRRDEETKRRRDKTVLLSVNSV